MIKDAPSIQSIPGCWDNVIIYRSGTVLETVLARRGSQEALLEGQEAHEVGQVATHLQVDQLVRRQRARLVGERAHHAAVVVLLRVHDGRHVVPALLHAP